MLKVIDKVSGSSSAREKVPEIEQKILEHGYRFELRLMFYCHENTSEIESEIRDILKELNFFNELALVKNKEKRTFLDLFLKRKYSGNSVDQMVSEAELLVILSGDVSVGKPDSILQAMEKTKQEVISRTITGSAIHLLPKPKKTEREVDVTISNMIPQALHTSKILKNNQKITIKSVETGPTVQIITCDIPQGAVFSDFRKRHEDLEAVLARKDMLSIIPGREPNTISFLLPLKKKEVIYLIEILQNPEFIQFAENAALPFVCGIDIFNNLVFKDLADGPHLLVCGSTNSGKSVFLNALLITLILMKKPDEMRMIMIDPKQVELTPYSGMAHVDTLITDMEEAYSTLESLCDEMDSRYTLFAKTGVKKIAQYNKKVKKKLPYVVAVVEEYADLHAVHPEVEDLIARLGAKARAAGIHLIIVTQKPNKDIISTVIQNNLPSKICFKLTKTQDYVPIFGSGIGYRLFGSGDGVVAFQNQTELFIRFQSACISPDGEEEELSLEKIKGFYKGEMVEGLDLAPSIKEPEEEPIDKLKRIIQETGETRVQPLASQMRIRTADVTDMLRQLVEDGFLTREGRGYALSNEPKQIVLPEQEEQTGEGVEDPLFNDAVQLVIDINEASISAIQRRFRIGYTRAAKLIDGMEQMGIVSEYNGIGTRRVLIDKNEWDNH
jgi:S-DNA-T family DNA segregation ATPase FtsK/SpoIIIE